MGAWRDLLEECEQELKDWAKENWPVRNGDEYDQIAEIANNNTPFMYRDLWELAGDNFDLLTEEPELGPANGSNFDGSNTPLNLIAANIYEGIERHLQDAWLGIESDLSEELDADEDEDEE